MSIRIPLTDEDLEELRNGKVFNWTFDGIDVELLNDNEVEE